MRNTGRLRGMECPGCGHTAPFHIAVTCWAEVHDSSTNTTWSYDWDEMSVCECPNCCYSNYVSEFQVQDEDDEAQRLCSRT